MTLGLGILFLYLKWKEDREGVGNTIVLNFASYLSNKKAFGNLVSETEGVGNNRKLVTYRMAGEDARVISDKVIDLPFGTLDGELNVKIVWPKNSEKLQTLIRTSSLGKEITNNIEKMDEENTTIESLREGLKRRGILTKILGGGELSKAEIRRMDEQLGEVIKHLLKSPEEKK